MMPLPRLMAGGNDEHALKIVQGVTIVMENPLLSRLAKPLREPSASSQGSSAVNRLRRAP